MGRGKSLQKPHTPSTMPFILTTASTCALRSCCWSKCYGPNHALRTLKTMITNSNKKQPWPHTDIHPKTQCSESCTEGNQCFGGVFITVDALIKTSCRKAETSTDKICAEIVEEKHAWTYCRLTIWVLVGSANCMRPVVLEWEAGAICETQW